MLRKTESICKKRDETFYTSTLRGPPPTCQSDKLRPFFAGITKGMVSDRENSLLMLATYIDTEPGIDAPLSRPLVPCRVVKQVGGPLISCIAGAGVYHLKEHATTSLDRHQQEWGLFH